MYTNADLYVLGNILTVHCFCVCCCCLSGLGFSAVARKAAEVFALVWAGSQVTKLLRAGAALACAPLIDKGLEKMGLHDKRKAYLGIVLACVVLATVVIGVVIALHA